MRNFIGMNYEKASVRLYAGLRPLPVVNLVKRHLADKKNVLE